MSLFDSVKNEAASRLGGEDEVAHGVLGMFGGTRIEALRGLVSAFQKNGLGAVVSSWIDSGQNHPISPEQLEQVIGRERLEKISSRFGLSAETLTAKLSQMLPAVVDKMTPQGRLPDE
ncbi:MAG: uncharacterized protein JWO13_1655 [Acidobacteriales bacterium]|nr:uncharacterized protein [Terriglobales bacterium]